MQRILYRATERAMGFCSLWSRRLHWGWLYKLSCQFAGWHMDIALKNRFWKINPAWTGNNDHPKYIDA